MEHPDPIAWCATFARLYAFEKECTPLDAIRLARSAYSVYGDVSPVTAVQLLIQVALTWPRTGLFESPDNVRDDIAQRPALH